MEFGQLTKYNKRHIFSKYHAENKAGRLILDSFLFFQKALYEVKVCGLKLNFKIF